MEFVGDLKENLTVKKIITAKNVQNLFLQDFYLVRKKLLEDLDVIAVTVWFETK